MEEKLYPTPFEAMDADADKKPYHIRMLEAANELGLHDYFKILQSDAKLLGNKPVYDTRCVKTVAESGKILGYRTYTDLEVKATVVEQAVIYTTGVDISRIPKDVLEMREKLHRDRLNLSQAIRGRTYH